MSRLKQTGVGSLFSSKLTPSSNPPPEYTFTGRPAICVTRNDELKQPVDRPQCNIPPHEVASRLAGIQCFFQGAIADVLDQDTGGVDSRLAVWTPNIEHQCLGSADQLWEELEEQAVLFSETAEAIWADRSIFIEGRLERLHMHCDYYRGMFELRESVRRMRKCMLQKMWDDTACRHAFRDSDILIPETFADVDMLIKRFDIRIEDYLVLPCNIDNIDAAKARLAERHPELKLKFQEQLNSKK